MDKQIQEPILYELIERNENMKFDTKCIHGSEKSFDETGAISVPIYQSATFVHPGVDMSTGYDYSRVQNPTREYVENVVAGLEGGADAVAFSTGMAALTALMELFRPGDAIITSDDLYGGSRRLFDNVSQKNGIDVKYVDTSNIDNIIACLKSETKALIIETPSNPMMQVTDLRAVTEIAKQRNILTIVDNTFLTPYFQKPLELGADIVLHSGTKYLGGHNDTLAGFLVAGNEKIAEDIRFIAKTVGSCLAPFDSWLIGRGIKTLPIRMRRQQETSTQLAQFLDKHDKIASVYYVGLENHPGYKVNKRQATGAGAMISFRVKSAQSAKTILETVSVISYAESLGGVETLMTYPMLQTHADVPDHIRREKGIDECLLRLSVGLEDAEDLIADLENALSKV